MGNKKEYKKITLKGGAEVYIEKNYEYAKCRGCDADDIIWGITVKNRKNIPIRWSEEEKAFICHFADCRGADKFR